MAKTLIQCVVVLYKQRPGQAKSLTSLLEVCSLRPLLAEKLRIFIQDNSPEPSPVDLSGVSPNVQYHHAPENSGLASAYNRALALAEECGAEWLLLLDQDTTLDDQFCRQLLAAVESDVSQEACAIVPELVKGRRVLSPHFVRGFTYEPCPLSLSGFTAEQLVPCNSAACLKVEALKNIGGFPEEYWLDFLDFIVFYRLQAAGGRVFVLDSQLEHSLSILNLEAEVSMARYANILAAEWRFIRETGARGGPFIHRMRLLKRALSNSIKLKNKAYASQDLRAALS